MFRDAPCLVLRDIEKLTRCSLRAIPVPSATPARAMARSRDRRHQACRGKHPRGRLQQAAEPPRRDSAAAYQHRIPARRTARCQFASGIPAPPVANQTWFGQTWFDRSPRRTARPHLCLLQPACGGARAGSLEGSSPPGVGAVMPQMDQIFSGTKAFQAPILARSLGQLATSFGGFFATCTAMYLCLTVSLWITLPMSALAAGFLVRIFIIQHDCGHGSFFRSRWANELIGSLCSLMTLTPYAFWRRQHARHHGSWNNLDRRAASGLDIYSSCMTVAEYRALGRWRRCLVRLTNHPIVANLLLPPLVFVILYRVPFDAAKGWRHERLGVYLTNLALADFIGGLGLAVGRRPAADHGNRLDRRRLAVFDPAPL